MLRPFGADSTLSVLTKHIKKSNYVLAVRPGTAGTLEKGRHETGHLSVTRSKFLPMDDDLEPDYSGMDDGNCKSEKQLWTELSTSEGLEKVDVLCQISQYAFTKAQYSEAITLNEVALETLNSIPASELNDEDRSSYLMSICFSQGYNHYGMNQLSEAIAAMQNGLKHAREGHKYEPAFPKKKLAEWLFEADNFKDAENVYKELVETNTENGQVRNVYLDKIRLAQTYCWQDRDEESLVSLHEALDFFTREKDVFNIGRCEAGLTFCNVHLNRGFEAEKHALIALDIFESSGDKLRLARLHSYLGSAYFLQDQFDEAREQLNLSLNILQSDLPKEFSDIYEAQRKLAKTLRKLGRDRDAVPYEKRNLTLKRLLYPEG